MMLWMVCSCPEGAMFKILLKSVEFKYIKNTFKDRWYCWRFWGWRMFLAGTGVLDDILDGLHMPWGSYVLNLVEICWVWRYQDPPSKINDISRILTGVDDDFNVPDWGWCFWWQYGWFANALRELCSKFRWNPMSLKESIIPSKIYDISRILAGVDNDLMFFSGADVLDDDLLGLHMPWGSYVKNLVDIRWVWKHQEPPQRWKTFL